MITLRPYQNDFEDGLRAAYRDGAKSVLGVMPTGAGKTVVFSDMAAKAQRKGNSVAIVAHRVEILEQIGKALTGFGVHHGYLAPGFKPDPLAGVQVCSVQAMARRIERYVRDPFDFLIIDEAHHAAAGTSWHAVINAHRSKRILGVTATPQRLSGEPLSVAFDQMVVGPTVSDLVGLGALTPYRIFSPPPPDMSGISRRGGDFDKAQMADALDRPTITGSATEHYRRICPGKRAVVFCVSIAHAEHVAAEFNRIGFKAASLDGKMDRPERRSVLARFANGSVPILTSCDIVSEGFDVPGIEVAILLRPTESLALYLQQVGRVLRPAEGKPYAIILDHAGNSVDKRYGGRGHGYPDDGRAWSLDGIKRGAQVGARAKPRVVCGRCFGSFTPRNPPCCPYCGFTKDIQGREIAAVEGDLLEVDPDLMRQARKEAQDAINRRVQQARTVPALAKLAVELGREAGWVFQLHKSRGNPHFMYGEAVRAIAQAKKEMADG